jgi:hypothetical protein
MIDTKYFEIPDFCATQTRQCDSCNTLFTLPCNANFGLGCTTTVPTCSCHDICVEEVRLIGTVSPNCEFTQCITYPPIGKCRLGPNVTFPIIDITQQPKVFVVCAEETLDSTCTAIAIKIKLLILAPTVPVGGVSGNVLIPLNIDGVFNTFFRFPDCSVPVTGTDLQSELTQIDGSCLVIQLKAVATRPGGPGTTTQIVVSGNIIDKLWKHENLWVTGIRPYELSPAQIAQGFVSFTIPDVFNDSHKIGDCNDILCPI